MPAKPAHVYPNPPKRRTLPLLPSLFVLPWLLITAFILGVHSSPLASMRWGLGGCGYTPDDIRWSWPSSSEVFRDLGDPQPCHDGSGLQLSLPFAAITYGRAAITATVSTLPHPPDEEPRFHIHPDARPLLKQLFRNLSTGNETLAGDMYLAASGAASPRAYGCLLISSTETADALHVRIAYKSLSGAGR